MHFFLFSMFVLLFYTLPFAVMSENYIVFIEQPIKLDLLKFMLYRVAGKSFHNVMSWNPDLETIFHVADRRTGQVQQSLSQHHTDLYCGHSVFLSLHLWYPCFHPCSSSRQNTTAVPCSPCTRLMHMRIMDIWLWTCAVEMMVVWLATSRWRTFVGHLGKNLTR